MEDGGTTRGVTGQHMVHSSMRRIKSLVSEAELWRLSSDPVLRRCRTLGKLFYRYEPQCCSLSRV